MRGKFAVLRLSALGDVILVSPVLQYLSEKGDVIFITYAQFSQIYEGDPRVSEVLTLPRKPRLKDMVILVNRLRSKGVEVVFDLQVKPITLLMALLLKRRKIPVVRTEKRSLRRRLHVLFGLPLAYRYVPNIHLGVVSSYFNETAPNIKPKLPKRPSPFPIEGPYIVLSPEASAPLKEWGMERFLALAHGIERAGYNVVWVGTKRSPTVSIGVDLRGRTDLSGFLGVISGASALVGNDSAALHVAYAFGIPAVVIMGPTVVNFGFVPRDPRVRVVEKRLKCRPCSTNGSGRCMVGGRPCMELDTDEVLNRLLEIITPV